MTTRWARVLRGQFVAAFATFTAAFSHGVADGAHPPLFAIALGLAFSGLACIALLGRKMPRVALAAAITVSQAFYHGLFSLFGLATVLPGTASSGAVHSHHHAPVLFFPESTGAAAATTADAVMLGAHAAAAAVTFAAVAYSERLCSGVAALARLIIAALCWRAARAIEPVSVRFSRPRRIRTGIPHRSLIINSFLRHRGPPATVRFA